MTNSYNDGLEAAAIEAEAFADQSASEGWTGPDIASRTAKAVASAIRALKQEEAPETSDPSDALIDELVEALEPFSHWFDDGRPHLSSAEVKCDAGDIRRAREALSKAKGVVS